MTIKSRIANLEHYREAIRLPTGMEARDRLARRLERIAIQLESVEHDERVSVAENMVRRLTRDGEFEASMEALRSGAPWGPPELAARTKRASA